MPLHADIVNYRRLTADIEVIDPLLMNESISFLRLVTGLTGGGSTKLDGVDTTRLTLPHLADVHITISTGASQLQRWKARTRVAETETAGGTNPEDFQYVLPDNYHATTNNVVWERVS